MLGLLLLESTLSLPFLSQGPSHGFIPSVQSSRPATRPLVAQVSESRL